MLSTSNGHNTELKSTEQIIKIDNADVEVIEATEVKQVAPKKRASNRKQYFDVEILMDCGANHSKAIVRFGDIEQWVHFPSKARIVEGNIAKDSAGNFTLNNENYATGKGSDYYQGEWLEAREGNKIDFIDVWFLALLTHAKKVLTEVANIKQRKGVIPLRCHIRMLSLAKERQPEIEELLSAIDVFEFDNHQFEVTIAKLKLHTEGYGSAVAAWNLYPDSTVINTLDMGGGTLSFTSFSTDLDIPDECDRTIADCGGVNAIVGAIQLGMSSRDNAGVQLFPELIEKSLRTSKTKTVLYDLGGEIENIFPAFESAMSDWLRINPQVTHLLKKVRFALMNDERVFLTGGGFASTAIREFITNYLVNPKGKRGRKATKKSGVEINPELIITLDDCHTLNVKGLKGLTSLIPGK